MRSAMERVEQHILIPPFHRLELPETATSRETDSSIACPVVSWCMKFFSSEHPNKRRSATSMQQADDVMCFGLDSNLTQALFASLAMMFDSPLLAFLSIDEWPKSALLNSHQATLRFLTKQTFQRKQYGLSGKPMKDRMR